MVDLGVSYQRGDTLGVSLNFQTGLGKPILPQRADPAPLVDVDRRPYQQRHPKEMVEKIHAAIHEAGFTDVSVFADGGNLTAEFANNKYLSNQKAVGRVLRILLLHAPSDTKKLVAILEKRSMPILKVAVKPSVFEAYLMGEVPEDIFERLVEVETTKEGPDTSDPGVVYAGGKDSLYTYGVKPEFQSYLNDPSAFFQFMVGIMPWSTANPWKGGEGFARFEIPFYSDISSSNVPPHDTVREDSWKYLRTQYTFTNLLLDQAVQFTDRTFGRVSFGYLEYMYAGQAERCCISLATGAWLLGLWQTGLERESPGQPWRSRIILITTSSRMATSGCQSWM